MYDVELEALFNEYEETFVQDPDFLIAFYEANEQKLSSANWLGHDTLFKYQSVATWYLWALIQKKQYYAAVKKSEDILPIAEKNLENLKIDRAADTKYHSIIKQRGIANYFRHRFNTAATDFNLLLSYEPQNADFKLWADMSRYRLYTIWLSAIAIVIIFGHSFYKPYLPFWLDSAILIVGVLCSISVFGFEAKIRRMWKNRAS